MLLFLVLYEIRLDGFFGGWEFLLGFFVPVWRRMCRCVLGMQREGGERKGEREGGM